MRLVVNSAIDIQSKWLRHTGALVYGLLFLFIRQKFHLFFLYTAKPVQSVQQKKMTAGERRMARKVGK